MKRKATPFKKMLADAERDRLAAVEELKNRAKKEQQERFEKLKEESSAHKPVRRRKSR